MLYKPEYFYTVMNSSFLSWNLLILQEEKKRLLILSNDSAKCGSVCVGFTARYDVSR